jgi:hypothetical protein
VRVLEIGEQVLQILGPLARRGGKRLDRAIQVADESPRAAPLIFLARLDGVYRAQTGKPPFGLADALRARRAIASDGDGSPR